jgi:flavodoxin
MKALVVYESFFGNTEKIARAVGTAMELEDSEVVTAASVSVEQIKNLDLLVVGSPTRAFQPCPDTKSFLKNLPAGVLKGIKVAAFDTRVVISDKTPGILKILVKVFGYSAEPIAKSLIKKGGTQVQDPAGFFVLESEGPLKEGELERAAEWAKGFK